eukprot:SAG25_NODE_15_length_24441_cov_175.207288_20_plen_105_part_00
MAERTLFLWNNEHIVQQITNFKDTVFPVIFKALADNRDGHWNSTVHQLTCNVQKLLMEIVSMRLALTLHPCCFEGCHNPDRRLAGFCLLSLSVGCGPGGVRAGF